MKNLRASAKSQRPKNFIGFGAVGMAHVLKITTAKGAKKSL